MSSPTPNAHAKNRGPDVKQLTPSRDPGGISHRATPSWNSGHPCSEGAVLTIKLWNLPQVELKQRAREARLRLEQLERLLVLRDTGVRFRLWRLVALSVNRARRKGCRLTR